MSKSMPFISQLTIRFLSALVIGLTAFGLFFIQKNPEGKLKEQNIQFENQLDVLNDVQSSIDNLKTFVTMQKTQLIEQQSIVEKLKSESERLKPVVEADKKIIEALFMLQTERNKTSIWIDRLFGFLMGIVGSLIASIIYSVVFRGKEGKSGARLPR